MSSSPVSSSTFSRAADFLRHARPLEQALFAFHFEHGSAAMARSALELFQNKDGGFHGLEADIGLPVSSVLCTCHALHILHELGTSTAEPTVQRALDYLLATYDPRRGVWPIIPAHDNAQPHAPWWHDSGKPPETKEGLPDNPRPDVLACLQAFPVEKTGPLRARVMADTVEWLRESEGKIEMHGLLCYVRLSLAPDLSAELKAELQRNLAPAILSSIERDPAKWHGYGLRPLDVAPRQDSPWHAALAPEIEANLDFLLRTQMPDGSWHPHWNWGDFFPEAWPAAKLRWQAVLTLSNLRVLRSHGRLAAGIES